MKEDKIKEWSLNVGLALNHIGMVVDDETMKKVDPWLKQIEDTVTEMLEVMK